MVPVVLLMYASQSIPRASPPLTHPYAAIRSSNFTGTLIVRPSRRLTFDMRGGRQLAKPDVGRPLDGRVRRHWASAPRRFRKSASSARRTYGASCSRYLWTPVHASFVSGNRSTFPSLASILLSRLTLQLLRSELTRSRRA